MNVRTRRSRLSVAVGASALLTAGALLGLAGPAHAAAGTADLALTVSGEKIAADASAKLFGIKVHNNGPDTATGIKIQFDFAGLTDKVITPTPPDPSDPDCKVIAGGKIQCSLTDLTIAKDLSFKLPFPLEHKPGVIGDGGTFSITVLSDGDKNTANDSATVHVQIPGNGVDLFVGAEDVFAFDNKANAPTDQPVPPGGTSFFFGAILNQGDRVAKGLKVTVTLPGHVTFNEVEPGCTYTADNRTVTCDYTSINLVPRDQDTNPDDNIYSAVPVFFPVKVASDAPGPVVLTGGSMTSVALATEDINPTALAAATRKMPTSVLPKGVKALTADDLKDIDFTDNTDDFAVHVAAPASGGGGGGGGLPVTGVQAGLIGGIGGTALITGAVLFMVARRRRVVLVTPGDEKSTV
jgi:hypothetical protein